MIAITEKENLQTGEMDCIGCEEIKDLSSLPSILKRLKAKSKGIENYIILTIETVDCKCDASDLEDCECESVPLLGYAVHKGRYYRNAVGCSEV